MRFHLIGLSILLAVLAFSSPAYPQDTGRMDNARLNSLIEGLKGISGNIESQPGFWLFEYQGRPVYVVVNPANRQLQILAPIAPVNTLNHATLVRALEANFSATNEARYAIAKGLLWSVYANYVRSLGETEFLVSLKQVVATASMFADLIVPNESKPEADEGSESGGVELITPESNIQRDGKS